MAVGCPSLPPKRLADDKLRAPAKHTARISTEVDHFAACSLYVLLIIIEIFFLTVRDQSFARTVLYKVSIAIVSRSFLQKNDHHCFDTLRLVVSCLTFIADGEGDQDIVIQSASRTKKNTFAAKLFVVGFSHPKGEFQWA